MSEATLFVGRLTAESKQRDIEELFRKYGKLARCFLKDKGAQSYAFVTFEDPASATKAFEELQGVELNGAKINIEKAKSNDRPRGPRTGSSQTYPSTHPYAYQAPSAYDARAPYSSSRSRRSRSRERSPRDYAPYDSYGRPPYDPAGYAYPPAHDPAAYYPYPPAAYDPYAAGYPPYGQPAGYGYGPPSAYPGSYMPPSSASNRSRSPYRSRGSPTPRSDRPAYGRRPRNDESRSSNSTTAASAPASSAAPPASAYSDAAYSTAAQ